MKIMIKKDLYEPATFTPTIIQPKLYMWPERILYFGPLRYVEPHTYGAVILIVGLYGPFSIRVAGGQWKNCCCAIVPAGIKHEVNLSDGILGKLFIEGGSMNYQFFCQRFSFTKTVCCFQNKSIIEFFRHIYDENMPIALTNEAINKLLGFCDDTTFSLDARINKEIHLITSDLSQNLSEVFLAKEVCLSTSRFRHLFHEKTGVSYRHY